MEIQQDIQPSQDSFSLLLRKYPVKETDINAFFQSLTAVLPSTAEELQQKLDSWDGFLGSIQDAQNLHYFQYLACLNDPEKLKSYQQFLQKTQAEINPWKTKLAEWIHASQRLHPHLPEVYQRFVRQQPKGPASPSDTHSLRQALQQTAGKHPQRFMAARIPFEGKQHSPQEISAIMRSPDRRRRKAAWEATQAARKADSAFFQTLFEEQLSLRHQMAVADGKTDFVSFQFEEMGRTAYNPQDCRQFHHLMAQQLPTFMTRLYQAHKAEMDWDKIYPWDLAYGPKAPKAIPKEESSLLAALTAFMEKLHPDWKHPFEAMQTHARIDIMGRPHKTPGAMTYQMKQEKLPLVIATYEGSSQGLTQVIHELGHATHFFLSHPQPLKSLCPIAPEGGELIALTFELLGLSHASIFYGETAVKAALKTQLYRVFSLLALSLTLDAFQHEVYTRPDMTAEARNACWKEQYVRFHGEDVFGGDFEEALSEMWLRHYHLFEAPFYSIEYALAQLAALQLWQRYQQAPTQTLSTLHQMMEKGNSKPIVDLYEEMGISLFPNPDTLPDLLHFCLKRYQ